MATRLFFRLTSQAAADTHRATNTAKLDTNTSGWAPGLLSPTSGAGVSNLVTNTVTGPTNGVEVNTGTPSEWISNPVSADVTISGTITANIWAQENNMSANVAINVIIDILRSGSQGSDNSFSIVNIVKSTRTTELGFSGANTVQNFTTGMTSGAYTGQTLNRGDRLRIRIFGDDAGTMATGFTFTVGIGGNTAAADGDSWVEFTETFSFESAPGGSVIYLTDTASSINPGSAIEKEAWTSRGAGNTTITTNTATGWTNGIQWTNSAGGTAVEWYTKQLAAFTLSGMVTGNIWLAESNTSANASARIEIHICAADGTGATLWGVAFVAPTTSNAFAELPTTSAAQAFSIGGDDTAVTGGQRIRIRVFLDDQAGTNLVTAFTTTLNYAATSGGSTGDSFLTFPQTLTEFVEQTYEDAYYYQTAVQHGANW